MKKIIHFNFVILISIFFGCQKNHEKTKVDLSNYQIESGFRLEVVAAEPLIEAPIALQFDEQGRLWVLELPGYMSNLNGDGETDPIGRILILEDRDGDGQMDYAKPFLKNLRAARTFAHAYGGILYAEPPFLYWVENINDRPGQKIIVDSTYVVGGNIEHQPNSLTRNIDNWWYSAKSKFRYRKIGEDWIKEPTSFRGQWGMTKDDYGRLFYNDNSNPLYGDFVRPNLLLKNKHHLPQEGISEVITPNRSVHPLHATAVNRGYIDGTLDDENKLVSFTSACGPAIYRGDKFPPEFYGNAFVCAPEANLIKRIILNTNGNRITGKHAYENREFIASTDESFRPVNLHNAPDGSLYVADMHRGIIQHKVYMTAYLREKLIARGLDSIVHFGRILKIVPEKNPIEKNDLSKLNTKELTQLFFNKNGWERDKSQQIIVEEKRQDAIPYLEKIISENENSLAQIHALWALEGLDALSEKTLLAVARNGNSPAISIALHLLEKKFDKTSLVRFRDEIKTRDNIIELQLCISAEAFPDTEPMLADILSRHKHDTLFYDAALAGLNGKEELFSAHLRDYLNPPIESDFQSMLSKTIKNKEEGTTYHQEPNTTTYTDPKTIGLKLYRTHCASCHSMDGHGLPNLAPPIYHSEYIEGDPSIMISIALHGMKGPLSVNGKKYDLNAVMPGLAINPEMTDEKIAAILTFIRHGYGRNPLDISAEEVSALRNTIPKDGMFTEEELIRNKN